MSEEAVSPPEKPVLGRRTALGLCRCGFVDPNDYNFLVRTIQSLNKENERVSVNLIAINEALTKERERPRTRNRSLEIDAELTW